MAKAPNQEHLRELKLAKAIKGSKAPAISRAAAVLRLLGKSDVPLGLQHIARELGLVPSTCLYVMRALAAEELVSFDADTKRYSLEAGVLTLAQHWMRHDRFSDFIQPRLDQLGEAFGATMLGLHIIGLDHVVVVAVSHARRDIQLSVQIGSRFPALISATGRCLAAFGEYPLDQLEPRFRELRWDSPPTFEEWSEQIAKTRAQGYAIDAGNYISGVTVIAAPVWSGRGKLRHALVAIGIGSAFEENGFNALPPALMSAAHEVSNQLSGGASSDRNQIS
jgi:DNA-binding IclR family transcriptional regulator